MFSANSLYRVSNHPFKKNLSIPTSKSCSNRLLILAALAPQSVTLSQLSPSSDTQLLMRCLKEMGLVIEQNDNHTTIVNSFPACEGSRPVILKTGDGGTTNRFLTALAARGKQSYHFHPDGPMKKRPMSTLLKVLQEHGVRIVNGNNNSFTVTGSFKTDIQNISVDCIESTQFASALMLALADTAIRIQPIRCHSSRPYLAMTTRMIRSFPDNLFPNPPPPDFSSLSYPLALGITCGQAIIKNCHAPDPFQADSTLIPIAQKMNAKVLWSRQGLEAQTGNTITPVERNCSDSPDLVPTLAFLASYARGTSRLEGLDVLRHKESDRIQEILRLLKTFQVSHSFAHQKNELTINGPAPIAPFMRYNPPDDHRMIMTAYLFMRKNSGGLISNTRHVTKSFPNFFELME